MSTVFCLVSRVSYKLHDFLSSLFMQDNSSVLVYMTVSVCVCFSLFASLKSVIMEVATEPLSASNSSVPFTSKDQKVKSKKKKKKRVSCEVQKFGSREEEGKAVKELGAMR